MIHVVYPSRSRWKSLCQINKRGTACSLSGAGGGKKWWQTLRSPSEKIICCTALHLSCRGTRFSQHLHLDTGKRPVTDFLTSSPHSVTITSFPDMSIRWRVLLDTSRLDLVVRRVASSAVLHTPITSERLARQVLVFNG